ncbi:hypothetical protein ACT7C9_01110 [Bacillus cereus]
MVPDGPVRGQEDKIDTLSVTLLLCQNVRFDCSIGESSKFEVGELDLIRVWGKVPQQGTWTESGSHFDTLSTAAKQRPRKRPSLIWRNVLSKLLDSLNPRVTLFIKKGALLAHVEKYTKGNMQDCQFTGMKNKKSFESGY